MAALAELRLVLLILHQHPRLLARVRLMASETVNRNQHFCFGVDHICYGVVIGRVAKVVFQGQDDNFGKIVFRQSDFPVEDCDQMISFQSLWFRIRPVAFKAKRINCRGTL